MSGDHSARRGYFSSESETPPEWSRIRTSDLSGLVMAVGGTDSGKTTLVRHLAGRLLSERGKAACLDADPGQSSLGPPSTLTLEIAEKSEEGGLKKTRWRRFVGSVTPAGHMLQQLAGCARLVEKARKEGTDTVLMDTSGLVDPEKGGLRLKLAKIDLLQPALLIHLQRGDELEHLVAPVSKSRKTRLMGLKASPAAVQRDFDQRRSNRVEAFRRYFKRAGTKNFSWKKIGVFPAPDFVENRLLSLEDRQGFVLALGIAGEIDLKAAEVSVLTPLRKADAGRVASISLGDLLVDPSSFEHSRIVKNQQNLQA